MQRIVITLVLIVIAIAAWLLSREATVPSDSAVVVAPQQVDVPVEALQTPAIDVERAPSVSEPEARDELATDEAIPALPPLPSLEVRAITPSGVPVAGVEISLYPAEPDERAIAEPRWRARQSGVTNGSGIVRFDSVADGRWGLAPTPAKRGQPGSLSDPTLAPGVEVVPGRYHVTGRYADLIGTARDVLISTGEIVDLDIPLVPAGNLKIHYRNVRGHASFKVLHAGIIVKSEGVRSGSSTTVTVPFGEVEVVFTV